MFLAAGQARAAPADMARGRAAQPPVPGLTRAPLVTSPERFSVQTLASGLDHPWGLQFLPDGRMLVNERIGRLRIVGKDGALSAPVAGVPRVLAQGQGGLFDVLLDPAFRSSRVIYFAYLEPRRGGSGLSVARAQLVEERGGARLQELKVIFRAEPAASSPMNIGGRLLMGRDGDLYVTVGDRFTLRNSAQSLDNDLGKIVRITPEGAIPKDNPFVGQSGARPEIWTYGHRNAEGLAIESSTGELWEIEHGPRGGDEVNLIRRGHNYGWPVILYGKDYSGAKIGVGTHKAGMDQPVYYWDPSIAPSGAAFYDAGLFPAWKGDLFVGALKAEDLRRLVLSGSRVTGEEILLGQLHERLRDVRQGPDGALYVLTDNANGRILRLAPQR
jgi:glucose/arabinose dehydrogenase